MKIRLNKNQIIKNHDDDDDDELSSDDHDDTSMTPADYIVADHYQYSTVDTAAGAGAGAVSDATTSKTFIMCQEKDAILVANIK